MLRRTFASSSLLLAAATFACCGTTNSAVPPRDAGLDAPDVPTPPPATDLPRIPIGYDAFRQWDRWPILHVGQRTVMRSTFDRAGGNEGADASHFLHVRGDGVAIPLEVEGPGVLAFVRTNHWHGSPWHYDVDGNDRVVQESSTADPNQPVAGSTFIPAAAFPAPLAYTWSTTQGADLSWVPIPFQQSLELGYERTCYGTGYYIVHRFPDGADDLSQPIGSWDESPPPGDVVDLLSRAGDDVAPTGAGVDVHEQTVALAADGAVTVADLSGPAVVRALRLRVPKDQAVAFGHARIRATWDDRAAPSIDAPVALFFGAGTLYDRTGAEWLVRSFPTTVHFEATTVTLSTYLPMPFRRHAKIELVGAGDAFAAVDVHVRDLPDADPGNWKGYLHATYRDQGVPVLGQDLLLLDTTQEEGSRDWCGSVAGTSVIFSDRAVLNTLEGDPRFFFDDSQTPQVQGTGTEEWGGGGDYWGGRTMTLPFAGHPVGAPDAKSAQNAEDQIESLYRFLLSDAMPFGRNARVQLEHGALDDSIEHYRTLTYWYGLPGACLVQTDALHVSDAADEAAHRYASPDASPPDTLTTRYEWGVDQAGGVETYPATADTGRHTSGTSEMTFAIDPKNYGVLLRRKLDQGFADQRAEVYVADDRDGATFVHAGTWWVPGSNQDVYSNPPKELDALLPVEQSSNRRWRDDELLIARSLTEGRTKIRVRFVFQPSAIPLQPGEAPPPTAWSEYRYAAYVWTLPTAP